MPERAVLRRAVDSLSPRERQIMELRFGLADGIERTQKEAADALGISQSLHFPAGKTDHPYLKAGAAQFRKRIRAPPSFSGGHSALPGAQSHTPVKIKTDRGVWMYNKVELCGVNTAQLPVLTEAGKAGTAGPRPRRGQSSRGGTMVEGNLRLVLSVVQRFAQRGENLDDLFQVGCIGLIKAIDNFDPAQPVRFSTYGVPMIIGEIRRFLRDNNALRVSRTPPRRGLQRHAGREALEKQLGREPTVDEIAQQRRAHPPGSDGGAGIGGGTDQSGRAGVHRRRRRHVRHRPSARPGQRRQLDQRVGVPQTVAGLTPREKRIMELRYLSGETQMEVAQEIGISQAQVSRLEKGALSQFRTRD